MRVPRCNANLLSLQEDVRNAAKRMPGAENLAPPLHVFLLGVRCPIWFKQLQLFDGSSSRLRSDLDQSRMARSLLD
jgi:hypothetical protein